MQYFSEKSKMVTSRGLFQAIISNNLAAVDSILAGDMMHLEETGEQGETVLHLALLYDSDDVAMVLMDIQRSLINVAYTNKEYYGQTPLHIAILNQNLKMVKELVLRGASLHARATGTFFTKDKAHNFGEYPLSFAICTGQKEIARFLVSQGASLTSQDSRGNTALHTLASQLGCRGIASKMYNFVLSLDPHNKLGLETISNRQGCTPLKLAALTGNSQLVEHILQRRRRVQWTLGYRTSVIYSLREIDTYREKKSLLSMVVKSGKKDSWLLLEQSPLREVLDMKWKDVQWQFWLHCFVYILYMIFFTWTVYHRPLETRSKVGYMNRTTSGPVGYKKQGNEKAYNFTALTMTGQTRFAGEIISLLGVLVILFFEILDLMWNGLKRHFLTGVTAHFHVLIFTFCAVTLSVIPLRAAQAEREDVALSLAVILGWIYLLYFVRGTRLLGPYGVNVERVLLYDVPRFLASFIVILCAFACAIEISYSQAEVIPTGFSSFPHSVFSLVMVILGNVNLAVVETAPSPVFVAILLIMYITLTVTLLLNLVLTVLNKAQDSSITQDNNAIWRAQLLDAVLTYERRTPPGFRNRLGVRGDRLGLEGDEWYISTEEKSELAQKLTGRCRPGTRLTDPHYARPVLDIHQEYNMSASQTSIFLVTDSNGEARVQVPGYKRHSRPRPLLEGMTTL